MRTLLLGAAALLAAAAVPASADAQSWRAVGFSAGASDARGSVRIHRGFDRGRDDRGDWRRDRDHDRDFRDDLRRDRDRDRDHRDRFGRGAFYSGYRDYQGDTLWRPDSFNDWWHERPNRAYPAWMARNQDCERMWWSGGDWRC